MKDRKKQADITRIPTAVLYAAFAAWAYAVLGSFFRYHGINPGLSRFFTAAGKIEPARFLFLASGYMYSVMILAAILASAFFIGKRITRLFSPEPGGFAEEAVLYTGLGLGALSYLTLFIGELGLLYAPVFFLLTAALAVPGIIEFISGSRELDIRPYRKLSAGIKIIAFLLCAAAIFNLLMSFTPEMFYDSLNYHLGMPNYYRVYHRILPLPYKILASYPLAVSMLYTMGIILKDFMIAKLLNWAFGILLVFSIINFCLRHLKSMPAAILAAAAFYLTPTVIIRSWTATNDIGLAFFIFTSLSFLINALREQSPGGRKWLLLSAVFAGLGMGTKYTSAFFIFGMLGIFTVGAFKTSVRNAAGKAALWLGVSIAVFSPWMLKNYLESGNPVHPFFSGRIKVRYPYAINSSNSIDFFSDPAGKTTGLKSVLSLPWQLSVKGGGDPEFASPDYYMIGSVFILFLPLVLLLRKDEGSGVIGDLIVFSVFSYIFWALFSDSRIKYYTPAVPALGVMAGYAIERTGIRSRVFRNALVFLFFILVLCNFLMSLPVADLMYRPFSLLTGAIDRDSFLSDSQPGYPNPSYAVYGYINRNLPRDARVLISGDAKCLYIDRKFLCASAQNLNPLIEYIRGAPDPAGLRSVLVKDGFTHIVVNEPETVRNSGYGNLYFSRSDLEILGGFWNSYLRELYSYKGVYLYEILPAKAETGTSPSNPVVSAYRRSLLSRAAKQIDRKRWEQALVPLSELIENGLAEHGTYYMAAVCHYYRKEYKEAEKYATIAYQQRKDDNYRKLLEILREIR
ncbi:MAG: glycosyltransferase family 39 protein [Elusimicrobia bacterium]|nr:glycosyltransferase family 39 protein [Elusimicrobiota bacterium]